MKATEKIPDGLPPVYTESPVDPPSYQPPPGIAHDYSTSANATLADADRALAWCARHPLLPPARLGDEQLRLVAATQQPLLPNPGLAGTIRLLDRSANAWLVTTRPGCADALVQAALPSYAALTHRPRPGGGARRAYFEMRVVRLGRAARAEKPPEREAREPHDHHHHHHHHRLGELFHRVGHEPARGEGRAEGDGAGGGAAIGFLAPPYPPFRLPGWQRGSVAVHGDDGRRFVANENGGVDFAEPFREGETVGLGIEFRAPPPASAFDADAEAGWGGGGLSARVFLTRDGRIAGGWDLARQTDAEAERIEGLRGERDLVAAVGVFGEVEVEVVLGEGGWRFRDWEALG
jgi:hypothetical protein